MNKLPHHVIDFILTLKKEFDEQETIQYRERIKNQYMDQYPQNHTKSIKKITSLRSYQRYPSEFCEKCKLIKRPINCMCNRVPKKCRKQYNTVRDTVLRAKKVNNLFQYIYDREEYEEKLSQLLIQSMGSVDTIPFPKNNRNLDVTYQRLIEEKNFLLKHPWVQKLEYLNKQIQRIDFMMENNLLSKRAYNKISAFKKRM